MKNIFIFIFAVYLSVNTTFASIGAFDAGSINQQYTRDMRLHEIQTRAKDRSSIIQKQKEPQKVNQIIPSSAIIQSISFIGNDNIPSQDLLRIVEANIGETASEQNISNMRKLLVKYYNANQFYSAIIFPDESNISSGELIFQIKEGGKNSITIE